MMTPLRFEELYQAEWAELERPGTLPFQTWDWILHSMGAPQVQAHWQAERDFARKVDQALLYDKPFYDPRVFREFAVVLEVFRERCPGGRILDLGCGPGWTSLFLARAGFEVLGVDISERMIEVATEEQRRWHIHASELAPVD